MGTIEQIRTGRLWYDVAARERHVIGEGPRIAPLLESEMDEEAISLVRNLRATLSIPDNSPMPEVTLITLRHPGMFRCQMEMGIELTGKGTISPRERELAVLRVALLCGAPFEWEHHVVHARRLGLSEAEIERVIEGSSAEGWTQHDRAVVRAVEELIADKCMSDETWDTLSNSWNEMQMLEMPMLVGCYFMLALQQNSVRIPAKGGLPSS